MASSENLNMLTYSFFGVAIMLAFLYQYNQNRIDLFFFALFFCTWGIIALALKETYVKLEEIEAKQYFGVDRIIRKLERIEAKQ